MQRVRIALPYLAEDGIEVTILAVRPEDVEAPQDPHMLEAIPQSVTVKKVSAPLGLARFFGIRGIAWRSYVALKKEGNKILENESFDCIYFSTTVFLATVLGPYWKKRFQVPYVLDYQVPWINDYYRKAGVTPPGGAIKFACAQFLARTFAPKVVRHSSHITVVSKDYIPMLQKRIPDIHKERYSHIPFGAPEKDFELLPKLGLDNQLIHFGVKKNIVYVGRVGLDMYPLLEDFFKRLKQLKESESDLFEDLLISFWGHVVCAYR